MWPFCDNTQWLNMALHLAQIVSWSLFRVAVFYDLHERLQIIRQITGPLSEYNETETRDYLSSSR